MKQNTNNESKQIAQTSSSKSNLTMQIAPDQGHKSNNMQQQAEAELCQDQGKFQLTWF